MVDINPPETGLQEPDSQARMWAMIAHLAGFLGYFLPVIGSLIGPLIVWQLKKDTHPYVDEQGKEALNFQITIAIAQLVTIVVSFILPFIGCFTSLLSLALWITGLIFGVLGGLEANKGKVYRYPFALRLVS